MKLGLKVVWRWARWPLGVLVVLYIGVVAYRIPFVGEKQRTEKAVEYIHAQKITIADVMGKNLPPVPNKEQNDATVEGVDANNNNIRDDVELAIFEKYPNSARVRAAQLQYGMTQQMFLTRVFNTETWKAVAEEDSRSFSCISETYSRADLKKYVDITDKRTKEVSDQVINTSSRRNAKDQAYKFATSYGLPNTDLCHVNLNILPN